jgi:hypothetical protein
VISITDGQIYLQSDLFNAGQRPALNVGISVSRVGGDAQTKAMRQVAGQLRLDLAQYRELAAFAQFASDLDTQTRSQLERGARLTELLKQDKYQPVALAEQVAVIYAGTQGYLDKVPVARVREWEAGFVRFLKSERADLLAAIEKQKALDDKLFETLKDAISTFNHQFGVEGSSPRTSGGGEGKTKSGPPAAEVPATPGPEVPNTPVPEVPPTPAPEKPAQRAPEIPAEPTPESPTKPAPEVPAKPAPQAPAKRERAQGSKQAAPSEERPSQLDQIRAAISDEPKPKKPREPKAK